MWIIWQINWRPRVQVPGGGEGIAKKTVSEPGSVADRTLPQGTSETDFGHLCNSARPAESAFQGRRAGGAISPVCVLPNVKHVTSGRRIRRYQ